MAQLLTLTTDFGGRDAYVAEMKGVLLSNGPEDMRLVDLSHDIAPFNIHEAALFLRRAVRRFPEGTIHLVVVDPGVGGSRRALLVRVGGQYLIGPDNSVFGYLYDGSEEVYELDPERVCDGPPSSTFHGRDLFAPAAALLASGKEAESFARPIESYQHLVFPMVELKGDSLLGRIIHIDHFGNLITNVPESTLRGFMGDASDEEVSVHLLDRAVRGLLRRYEDAESGHLLALVGSSGLLEVAAREKNAAHKLGAEVGLLVRVQR